MNTDRLADALAIEAWRFRANMLRAEAESCEAKADSLSAHLRGDLDAESKALDRIYRAGAARWFWEDAFEAGMRHVRNLESI